MNCFSSSDDGALDPFFKKLPSGGFAPPKEFFDAIGTLGLSEKELKKIDVPVKVLIGAKDVLKHLYVDPLKKARKDWPVVEITDGDHITCILRPQFKDEIAAWVRKNTR